MTRFAAFLLLLALVFHSASGGEIKAAENGERVAPPIHKMTVRKLMQEVSLDYDYGGPNPKHDPRKGKPPGPSKSL